MTGAEIDDAIKHAYFLALTGAATAYITGAVYVTRRERRRMLRGSGRRLTFRPGPAEPRTAVRRHRSPVERPLLVPLAVAAAEAPGAVRRAVVRRSVAAARWCRRWAVAGYRAGQRGAASAVAGARRTVVVLREMAAPSTVYGPTWLVGAA